MRRSYLLLVLLLLAAPACNTGDVTDAPPVSASSDATVDEVCKITSELMGVDRSQVMSTTSLGDLRCDELDFVELIMEIEDRFNISIPDETAEQLLETDNWQAGMKNVTMQKLADAVRVRTE
ncbi:MAG: acyl carrier protein [Planctomycetes bacterium]|nr:acyl carrier protein [Planctomycetota bacterium]